MFFETTSKFFVQSDTGQLKKKTHKLLVDATDFIEAQTYTTEFWKGEAAPGCDVVVSGARQTQVLKVLGDPEAQMFFKFVISFVVSDNSGKEKWIKEEYIIGAANIVEAEEIGERELITPSILFTKVVELKETKLDAVLLYEEPEEEEEEELLDGEEEMPPGFNWPEEEGGA